jgi:quercetin dioxygenase-like cupin family protein
MSLLPILLAVACFLASTACQRAAAPGTSAAAVKRTLISEQPVPGMPEHSTRLYLIEFPPGAASQPHVHPTPGVGYVLEGSFESSYQEGPTTITRAGESFIDLPHLIHHFRNPDPVHPLRFVVAGTYRQGEPLFQLAP